MSDRPHIVWNPNKGDVLSRFYSVLARETGWTIGKGVRKDASLNYFGLYITVGQSPKVVQGLGKTAALFSHYETEVPQKVDWWNAAAPIVDIRLTWAAQYLALLEPHGASYLVTPPIDPQFKPRKKPVIGVSGYVHPGGRKGEALLKRLVIEESDTFEIVASGVGWPVPPANIRERKWEEMPAFYESLDVYLVTSLTEGIPMPPLEALAMGKRVVIPMGVGLLDELRNPRIYRYDAGDYTSMYEVLRDAAGTSVNPMEEFSERAWVESHLKAFGLNQPIEVKPPKAKGGLITAGTPYIIHDGSPPDYFIPIEAPVSKRYTVPQSGAIVVAYGAPARECAEVLIKSWQRFMSPYPIALVSDTPLGFEDKFIFAPDTDIGARSVKTQLYELAPRGWKNILYLDADTEITADVSVIFQWLADGFDFLICTNPNQYATIAQGRRPDNLEELELTIALVGTGELLQMNGGVFAFRRGKPAEKLMGAWFAEWQRFGARDQLALIRALHQNPLRWRLLGNEFNTVVRFCPPEMTAGILHYAIKARRWTGIIQGRLDSAEAWSRIEKKGD